MEKLSTEISAGRVVIVAGTGVSVATCQNQEIDGHKVATWTGLLGHGAQRCRDIGAATASELNLLNQLIESGQTSFLISAAEEISRRLVARSPGVYRGWLKDTVGQLQVKDPALINALNALPAVLATLSYDGLIESATGRKPVTWLQAEQTQSVLRREVEDAVLHLHGWFEDPRSVVLGLRSYLTAKDAAHPKAVLKSLCIQRVLLFVGCGDTLSDPNFAQLIEWAKEALEDVAPRHYLLCRTPELPDFQKHLLDAPWLQPIDYGERYEDLLPFLQLLESAGQVSRATRWPTPSGGAFDFDAYRNAMRKYHGRLKLEELDPTTHDIRSLMLTGMFIEQSARECAEFMPRVFELPKELQRRLRETGELQGEEVDDETLQQYRRAYVEQQPRPVLDVISDPALNRIVVLGDPGSGKSTLLQYVLLSWAECSEPSLGRHALPIIVPLREYARLLRDGKQDGFLSYLHRGAGVRWHFDQERLHSWLKENPSQILFDGLDEVFDPVLRREVSTAIHRFADEYPLARIAVTSRIVGYQHHAWRDEHFRHVMLQELDEPQIAEFITRWHRTAYDDPLKGEEKRVLLSRAIEDSDAIRQLAGNPLLLTMMAILNRTQDLPRDRAELYEQCARLLLHQWKVDAAFGSDPELAKASLDFKDKRGLLLRVARAMQTSERGLAGNLIDEATLEATLAEGLKGVPNLRPERAARALIEQLRGRNFMLCSVGGQCYAFVHRTFLEFFCALEIRARFETEQSLSIEELKRGIFGHWRDETWHEVLRLLAGMTSPHFVAQILDWLLAQFDPDDTYHQVFLAARCVGEVRKRAELGAVEAAVRDRTKALTRFDPIRDYASWRGIGRHRGDESPCGRYRGESLAESH